MCGSKASDGYGSAGNVCAIIFSFVKFSENQVAPPAKENQAHIISGSVPINFGARLSTAAAR
jgi:hypothetical protein